MSVWDTPQSVSRHTSLNGRSPEKERASEERSHDAAEQTGHLKHNLFPKGDVAQFPVPQSQKTREVPLDLPCPEPQIGEVLTGEPLGSLSVAVPAVGSRAAVIFGRSEHIALVRLRGRTRRKSASGDYRRLRHPVAVRDIPSITEEERDAARNGQPREKQTVPVPSLWDWSGAGSADTEDKSGHGSDMAGISADSAARQSDLWDRVAACS